MRGEGDAKLEGTGEGMREMGREGMARGMEEEEEE